MDQKPLTKIIVVVGPTASGKSSLGITLAKAFNGEVISADSRQVYRGLNIGSGKVTKEEMGGVPHHLLDIADPNIAYTAADFARDAQIAIQDVADRKKLPIIVGGTFFYIDMALGTHGSPKVPPNLVLRTELEPLTTEALYAMLQKKDPRRAENIDQHNPRRLIRALEIVEALGSVPEHVPKKRYEVLTIGIDIPKETLHQNIHNRLISRIEEGMIEEVKALLELGVPHERLESFGLEYRYVSRFLQGLMTKEEMVEKLESEIRKFAKRQMTWLKGDTSIQWFGTQDLENITATIKTFLEQDN